MVLKGSVEKIKSGIPGFDEIGHGGIPKGRTTLLSGSAGSGKTIFGIQFLYNGIVQSKEGGVFIPFEERPKEIIKNVKSFGWDLEKQIKANKLAFVDASPGREDQVITGEFTLDAFLARILHAIKKTNAKRVVLDSISAIYPQFGNPETIRRELRRLLNELNGLGVTSILSSESSASEPGAFATLNMEEFVSDNVVLLHNYYDQVRGTRRRSCEILKYRGADHDTEDSPLLVSEAGLEIFPRPSPNYHEHSSSQVKTKIGITGLDEMFMGGVYKQSTTLVTGASGSGKTVTSLHFIMEGIKRREKCLYLGFEESSEQVFRNAHSFGWDLKGAEADGKVFMECTVPEELKAEEHFKKITQLVKKHNIKRFVIDSLSAIDRIYPADRFREFIIGLNAFLKRSKVTSFFTNTTASLLDTSQITETHLSTVVDNIVLLKYVELDGQLKRAVAVIKARGTEHDKRVRQNMVDSRGVHVLNPFFGVENLMGGSARRTLLPSKAEIECLEGIEKLRDRYISNKISAKNYQNQMDALIVKLTKVKRVMI